MSVELKSLEAHLANRSYLEGYAPSQADVKVFSTLGSAPSASEYPHASRWYAHIASWESEHSSLPAASGSAPSFAAGAATESKAAESKEAKADAEDDDDDVDLFGSDDEEDEAETERIKQERVAEYQAKRAAKEAIKPAAAAKSVVTLQVKPWDDETDMKALEDSVRSIEKDGLLWGKSQLKPIGYGIRMLQINLVIEDEKISVNDLQEEIEAFEDYVQSTDVAAMQKL